MKVLERIVIYAFLILCSLLVILPILWIVISSIQPSSSLYSSSFIPKGFTLKHFYTIFTETNFPLWYLNTLKIALINMVVSVSITTLAAYAFSRYRFAFKKNIMTSILLLQMFPSFIAMTAIYIIMTKLSLLDTYLGLLLVYLAGQLPYNTWLVKGYLDRIPKELDEAAKIDGAGHFTIFLKIIFPLARPIVVLLATTNFIAPWFDYISPSILLRTSSKKTLAVGIFEWISGFANDNFTQFASASLLVAIPITILFILLQKHIVEGLTQGAVKS